MAARGPKGVVTRSVPDWLIARGMGGGRGLVSSPGNYAYIELTNNATDGSYLWVYGLTVFVPASDNVPIEFWRNSLAVCPGSQGPLQTDQPTGPGLTGALYSTVTLGTVIGFLANNNAMMFWPFEFPLCKLAPGWSLGVHNGTFGNATNAGFWWIPITGQ